MPGITKRRSVRMLHKTRRRRYMEYHRAKLESSVVTGVGGAARLARAATKDNGRRRYMKYHLAQLESSAVTAVGGAAQLARAAKGNGRRRNMRYHHAELNNAVKTVVAAANKNVKLVGSTVEAWGSANSTR